MRRSFLHPLSGTTLLVAAAMLVACDGTQSPIEPEPATLTVAPSTVQLQVGATATIETFVANAPAGATVMWRSNDPAIASAVAPGVITAVAPGQTLVTALLSSDTTVKGFIAVTVLGQPTSSVDTMPVLGLGAVSERYTAEVAVRGNWAYTTTWSNRLAAGNAVKIWDVSGATPVLRDSLIITGAGTTGDVQISEDGSIMVVAVEYSGAIVIFDRSDPARPQQLSRFSSPNTGPGVHTVKLGTVNGRHYAFLSVNPGSVGARLVIVDITNPAAPVQVFQEAMGQPYIHDVFVRDGILFTALWHEGFRIYDIGGGGRGGSPSAPVLMGALDTRAGYIHNLWWYHSPDGGKRYLFLGEEGPGSVGAGQASGDIHVIDVSNMSAPVQVAQYAVAGAGTHNFAMDEQRGILYAAYYNGGVRAIDVKGDLGGCAAAQRNLFGFCDLRAMGRERGVALLDRNPYVWGVVHQGDYVYASDMKMGLYKLDASQVGR